MIFKDRTHAAKFLLPLLSKYKGDDGVVLAVPRGGIPIGFQVAKYLSFPLDLVMTKKLGHPFNPEYAIGAVNPEGFVFDKGSDVPEEYVNREAKRIQGQLKKRYHFYRDGEPPLDLKDKTVIISDDGIATGKTILSTIELIRKKKPKKIVIAVPVAPPQAIGMLKSESDDFICLYSPGSFFGVGQFYEDFKPVNDESVIELLRQSEEILNH